MFLSGAKEIDREAKPIDFGKYVLKDWKLYLFYLISILVESQNDEHSKTVAKIHKKVGNFQTGKSCHYKTYYFTKHIKLSPGSTSILMKCKNEVKDIKTIVLMYCYRMKQTFCWTKVSYGFW